MSTSAQIGATAANERVEQLERRLAGLEAENERRRALLLQAEATIGDLMNERTREGAAAKQAPAVLGMLRAERERK